MAKQTSVDSVKFFLKSAYGTLEITITENFVTDIRFTTQDKDTQYVRTARKSEAQKALINQLRNYFSKRPIGFDVPTKPKGSDFQIAVWEEMKKVPYGKTATYAEIATGIGRPRAVRAVANAIAKNPLAIIVPCHRIIRSDGTLGGYAWGIGLKKRLLELERQT